MPSPEVDPSLGPAPIPSATWRSVVAVLANEHTQAMTARLILGEDIRPHLDSYSPSRRKHIVKSLVNAGVAHQNPDGAFTLNPDVFRRLLAQEPARKRTGVDRFLEDGRIATYPAAAGERAELLQWVVTQALSADETVSEREINERLKRFTPDVAVLRRYLVDFGLVERRRDGTEYSRAAEEVDGETRGGAAMTES